ncbi:MAG: MBL fold metallo-hydrolase [Burkholderiaceae bacterium]
MTSSSGAAQVSASIKVLERGWLSSNSVVLRGAAGAAVVDTGYVLHAAQTVDLVKEACGGLSLIQVVNTHLHSDHCGGNAALQAAFASVQTWIPSRSAEAVRHWKDEALSYRATGQQCPRFAFTHLLQANTSVQLAGRVWDIYAAPGHDPDAVMLFEPQTATLISADALWHDGFGVLFPLLHHDHSAVDAARHTLQTIAQLQPKVVIPGHGPPFDDVQAALARAHDRLDFIAANPAKHRLHAARVLIKFHLMQVKRLPMDALVQWVRDTPYLQLLAQDMMGSASPDAAAWHEWLAGLLNDLVRKQAIELAEEWVTDLT